MTVLRGSPLVGALVLSLALGAAPVAGQSLLAAGGLGVTMDPVDGRGRALGAVGPGLFGTGVIPGDPGSALDLTVPTIAVSLQSSWLNIDEGTGTTTNLSGSRVPALGIAYPVRRWGVLTVTYGGVLDQRWTLQRQHLLPLNTGGAGVSVTDRFISDGGVSAVRVGFARRLGRRVGVAAALGSFTGTVTRAYSRTWDSLTAGVPVKPFQSGGQWTYSGITGVAGVVFDAGGVLRVGGTVTMSGSLNANAAEGNDVPGKSYDMPIELRVGASGTLAPGLSAVVSGSYADWSATSDDLGDDNTSGAAKTLGAGLEWEGARLFGRGLPIRAGWRRAELPFGLDDENAVESTFAGGVGLQLVRAGALPLAEIDIALERGDRSTGSLSEDFWRTTVSLRLAGF